MVGGYKILDLSDVSFTGSEKNTVSGSYNTLERSRKATLVEGLNVDGTEYVSAFYDFVSTGGAFEATVGKVTIKVESDDGITVTIAE